MGLLRNQTFDLLLQRLSVMLLSTVAGSIGPRGLRQLYQSQDFLQLTPEADAQQHKAWP